MKTLNIPQGRIGIDSHTGALASLRLRGSRSDFITGKSLAGLLRLAAPLPKITGNFLEAGTHGDANIEPLGDGLRLHYAKLSSPHASLPIRVEVDIVPAGGGFQLKARVHNGWEQPIPQVIFPQIFGLGSVGTTDETRLQLGWNRIFVFKELTLRPDDSNFFEMPLYRYLPYGLHLPAGFNMKWFDYGNEQGGFTLFSHDPTYKTQGLLVERPDRKAERANIRWMHYPYIEPGETWESPTFTLMPHTGDWYAGAKEYQKFTRKHYPYRAPKRIREALGFRSIWMTYPGAAPMYRYKDLPGLAKELDGLDLVEMVTWCWYKCASYPMDTSPDLGTVEEYRDAIRRCQEMGVTIAPFVSHRLLLDVPETDPAWLFRNAAGQSSLSNYTFNRDFLPRFRPPFRADYSYVVGSAQSPGWRERGLSEYRKVLDHGGVSICCDQFFPWGQLEFNPTRTGRPADEGDWLLEFGEKARELIHARNPEGAFSGEGSVDAAVPFIDYTWQWYSGFEFADWGPFRYVFPDFRLNANVNEHPRSAILAFVEGAFLNVMPRSMEGRLSECPRLVFTLKQLAKLRRQFLPYFTEGQFHFMEGLETSRCLARLYTHDQRVLVLITNPTDTTVSATITLDLSLLSFPAAKRRIGLFNLKGKETHVTQSGARRIRKSLRLKPDELQLLEITPASLPH